MITKGWFPSRPFVYVMIAWGWILGLVAAGVLSLDSARGTLTTALSASFWPYSVAWWIAKAVARMSMP